MRVLVEWALRMSEIKKLKKKMDSLLRGYTHVPPGHFYSPIPSLDDIRSREDKLWGSIPEDLPGIDLNTEKQLNYFREFVTFYKEMPFTPQKNPSLRYFFNNPAYSYSDAICLYSMIRKAKPKKIIEVGSGYSSCVMMDTNEIFFQNGIDIAFIEPYPNLFSLMKEGDRSKYRILPKTLQNVELDLFRELSEDDILFIDSTHVSKVGSDVNAIIFDILPSLSKGVLVHFHDVFYPFEYNKEWIYQGIAWNEAYILKAFLQYNNAFEIVFFNTYLEYFYREQFEKWMPLCLMNPGGSIWLRKTS